MLRVAALQAEPRPVCLQMLLNQSVTFHEYHAAAQFCLQKGHATALVSAFAQIEFFGTFWLCFGSGLVLGLWYLDFKLGISIVWV